MSSQPQGHQTARSDASTGQPAPQDGHLPSALQRLEDAIAGLCDPVQHVVDGKRRQCDPLYTQLRDSLPGNRGTGGTNAGFAGCWITALDLLTEIDTAVSSWQTTGHDTPDRLDLIQRRAWRPQDVASIDQISDACTSWAQEITALLTPELKLALTDPCPNCGATEAHHVDRGGERVRSAGALTVTVTGCRCGACREVWTDLHWLGRVLGHLPTES